MTKSDRRADVLYCDDPSLTKQSFREECDINEILKRSMNGQDISLLVNERVAKYGDFSQVPSYQECMDIINRANGMFLSLGPNVRERFGNDPAKMLAFLQDDSNRAEAEKLGLVKPKEVVGVQDPGPKAPGNGAPGGAPPGGAAQ